MLKNCAIFFISFIVTLSAFGENDRISRETLLTQLPARSGIIITKPFALDKYEDRMFFKRFGEKAIISTYILENTMTFQLGEKFLISDPKVLMFGGKYFADCKACKTVGSFEDEFNGFISLVWDDPEVTPFPGVSDDLRHDLLMSRIITAIKDGKYEAALLDFTHLEKMGRKQPESFYYYYVVALEKAGQRVSAKNRGIEFLKNFGNSSKYYNDVLSIVSK